MSLLRIDPSGSDLVVPYPSTVSEFEIQAFLYMELMALGIDARGEVKARGCFGTKRTTAGCRFDIVCFEDHIPKLIIEVKDKQVKHKRSIRDTRQGSRYPMFGLPVWVIYGMDGARSCLEALTSDGSPVRGEAMRKI